MRKGNGMAQASDNKTGVERITHAEYLKRIRAQESPSRDLISFVCPMCRTHQSMRDLIEAGAGKTEAEVERYIGFSCVGRWTDAGSPRGEPDGAPCNWTLGGLFRFNRLEVEHPDGGAPVPHFEISTPQEAASYRANRKEPEQ